MRGNLPIRCRGTSTVELALLLPILLMLVLGVVDFGRALQFNNILVGMSREGANSAARTSTTPTDIITALGQTGQPMQMNPNGMIFITTVVGRSDGRADVQSQYRYTTGNTTLASKIYTCRSWGGGGVCNVSTAPAPIVTLSIPLAAGDLVHVAESIYYFTPITGYVMTSPITLYSATML